MAFVALPEIVLLAAASIVLVVDLFVSDERRNVTYGMAMLALAGGRSGGLLFAGTKRSVGFGGMYIADPMGHVLKLFAIFCCGFMLICAQSYARDRGLWKGEMFSLTLFTLLGIMLMISANNLLVIYLGLELQALSMYTLVALRRDDPRAQRSGDEVLRPRFAGVGIFAVWHEHALWRDRHTRHQRTCRRVAAGRSSAVLRWCSALCSSSRG